MLITECMSPCQTLACYSQEDNCCADYYQFMFDGCINPYAILGMKPEHLGIVVRSWLPDASRVWVKDMKTGRRVMELKCGNIPGLFTGYTSRRKKIFDYTLEIDCKGKRKIIDDPYRFENAIIKSEKERFESSKKCVYELLGAHHFDIEGCQGLLFTVRAAAARQVSLTGSFDKHGSFCYPMKLDELTGIWSIFLPGEVDFFEYTFRVRHQDCQLYQTHDPYSLQQVHHFSKRHLPGGIPIGSRECSEGPRGFQTSDDVRIFACHINRLTPSYSTNNAIISDIMSDIKNAGFSHLVLKLAHGERNRQENNAPASEDWHSALFSQARQAGLKIVMALIPESIELLRHTENYPGRCDINRAHNRDLFCCKNTGTLERCLADNASYWIARTHLDGFLGKDELLLRREDGRYGTQFKTAAFMKPARNDAQCCVVRELRLDAVDEFLPYPPESVPWLKCFTIDERGPEAALNAFLAGTENDVSDLKEYIEQCHRSEASEKILAFSAHARTLNGFSPDDVKAKLRSYYALMWCCAGSKILMPEATDSILEDKRMLMLLGDLNLIHYAPQADTSSPSRKWLDTGDNSLQVLAYSHQMPFETLIVVCNAGSRTIVNFEVEVSDAGTYEEILNTNSVFYGGNNLGNAGELTAHAESNERVILNMILPAYTTLYLSHCTTA